MSFSTDVKSELQAILPSAMHCKKAGLAAILCQIGTIAQDKNKASLTLISTQEPALAKCFTLLKKTTKIKVDAARDAGTGARRKVCIPLTEKEAAELADWTEGAVVSKALLRNSCCKKSALRDMFLCVGSVNDPEKEYHLEFNLRTQAQAGQVQELLGAFGISAKITGRKRSRVVYLKDSDTIADALNLMGAHTAMMRMQNSLIRKEMRNTINRIVNFEAANIEKTVQASGRQLEDIRFLRECGVWQTLPDGLKEVALLREKYPEASLKEIGDRLSPPVGKSGVNHRLRRLSELAEQWRAKEGRL